MESVWTVEHVVMGVDYKSVYPYSEDGRAPAGGDTVMPDSLGWLSFAARRAGRLGDGFFPYVIAPEDLAERRTLPKDSQWRSRFASPRTPF